MLSLAQKGGDVHRPGIRMQAESKPRSCCSAEGLESGSLVRRRLGWEAISLVVGESPGRLDRSQTSRRVLAHGGTNQRARAPGGRRVLRETRHLATSTPCLHPTPLGLAFAGTNRDPLRMAGQGDREGHEKTRREQMRIRLSLQRNRGTTTAYRVLRRLSAATTVVRTRHPHHQRAKKP